LEVKIYPDTSLRVETQKVERFDSELKDILRAMADTMYLSEGVGLAATQVGLDRQVFVMDTGEGLLNMVNPERVSVSKKKSVLEEGCLSLPGVTVKISRPVEVRIKAQDGNGDFFVRDFSGLAAKAVQHEMDHLKGKLIIDRLGPIGRFLAARKIERGSKEPVKKTCEVVCDT
jgi:peptide deformylase